MFFRGRQPETSIWKRFRTGLDGFTFSFTCSLSTSRRRST
jgi:hypothetical protein